MDTGILESFIWSFLGIVVEALPFIIIGSLVSAVIQVYLSEDLIRRCIPKASILGYLGAVVSGILFPICECAIIPITRSLMKKGLPVGIGVSFMLAVPIVNPIVIMSTYYAFPDNISIVVLRTLAGALAALIVGLIVGAVYKKTNTEEIMKENIITLRCECCTTNRYAITKREKLMNLINHGSNEFLNISVYFIIGALISSVFSALINNDALVKISTNNFLGTIFMIALSFMLSLCSEADAFVAKSFLSGFGIGPVIAFLIMGPMMDLKNAFLAFGVFKNKFAARLIGIITAVVTIIALIISLM